MVFFNKENKNGRITMEPKHNNTGKYICAAIIGVSIIIGTVVIGTAIKNGFVYLADMLGQIAFN